MRWREIAEKLEHAVPLIAQPPNGRFKKAQSLVPPATPPMDPGTAIATAIPQIAQVVAGSEQQVAQTAAAQAVAQEQEAERQQALAQAQQQATIGQPQR